MAEGSGQYHEPYELLSEQTRNVHRAVVSLIEELEAVDWYQQRADATTDDQLRRILVHNRDEELEHAMMSLEWLRRALPELDTMARRYLFSEGEITAAESDAAGSAAPVSGSLGLGSLREGGS
jgi:ferritin-like protein